MLAAESLPYPGEEYVCAALTTSDLPSNFEVGADWRAGNDPSKTSYCSPWVLATIKHRSIVDPQGKLSESFTDEMVEEATAYLDLSASADG